MGDSDFPPVRDMDFDLVAFLQPRALTIATGNRTARLFPHIATRIAPSRLQIASVQLAADADQAS